MAASAELKHFVVERADFCCEYCRSQLKFSSDSFSIEHVIPRSQRGTDCESNLALSCQGCNNRKFVATQAIDPLTGRVAPLYHPRKDRWHDHFVWSQGYSLIQGITPVGRATVARLQLNREGIVNLRGVLFAIGAHPPSHAGGN